MKQKLCLLISCVMALMLFSGCSSKPTSAPSSSGNSNAPAESKKDVEWPKNSVQFIVPAKAGGGTDLGGRIFATSMQKSTGKPFVVVNQETGGGTVAAENVRNAKPDGNTLLFYHTSLLVAANTGVYNKSILDDFTLLAYMPTIGSYCLTVKADSPYQSVEDLVKAAKAKPKQLTLGIQTGGSTHFMGGLFAKESGAEFKFVEAGSDTDKLTALQGGHIDLAFINSGGASQYAEAKKVRILATIGSESKRDPMFPNIPTLAELGYKNALYGIDFIILGPKGMDAAMVEKINATFKTACADPDVSAQLEKIKMPVVYKTLGESKTLLKDANQRIGDIANVLGLKK